MTLTNCTSPMMTEQSFGWLQRQGLGYEWSVNRGSWGLRIAFWVLTFWTFVSWVLGFWMVLAFGSFGVFGNET